MKGTVAFTSNCKGNSIGKGPKRGRGVAGRSGLVLKDAPFKLFQCKLNDLSSLSVKHWVAAPDDPTCQAMLGRNQTSKFLAS